MVDAVGVEIQQRSKAEKQPVSQPLLIIRLSVTQQRQRNVRRVDKAD